eukprot:TRINITY_DN23911_c0_g1_i1.p1 TRINITY_DN23911_c0_g1~~TRINITY_DN23911_c0_g1_i1.p1  ORF type:complete len:684 (+),score=91.69 TRINITY_DN23911_c0_g1_i1:55-2052(+)
MTIQIRPSSAGLTMTATSYIPLTGWDSTKRGPPRVHVRPKTATVKPSFVGANFLKRPSSAPGYSSLQSDEELNSGVICQFEELSMSFSPHNANACSGRGGNRAQSMMKQTAGSLTFNATQRKRPATASSSRVPTRPSSPTMSPSATSQSLTAKRPQSASPAAVDRRGVSIRSASEASLATSQASTAFELGQGQKTPAPHYRKVTNSAELREQMNLFVHHLAKVWETKYAKSRSMTASQLGSNTVKVRAGRETYSVPRFLMQDVLAMSQTVVTTKKGRSIESQHVKDVRLTYDSPYFSQVILLLKMRWLLRLHSAACELEFKLCSLANVIKGLQQLILKEEEAVLDTYFDGCQKKGVSVELFLSTVVEDLLDQLQRRLGHGWGPFVQFVNSCSPGRRINSSKTNSVFGNGCREDRWSSAGNGSLGVCIDTAFLANFLRQPYGPGTSFQAFGECLNKLGVPNLTLPPMAEICHLFAWLESRDRPTGQANRKVSHRDAESLAQLDAVLLTAALEVQSQEVLEPNSHSDVVPRSRAPTPAPIDPDAMVASSTWNLAKSIDPAKCGPPQLRQEIQDAAVGCINHHETFPAGLRQRLICLLLNEYSVGADGVLKDSHLAPALRAEEVNVDGKCLMQSSRHNMGIRERARLREFEKRTGKPTFIFTRPPCAW